MNKNPSLKDSEMSLDESIMKVGLGYKPASPLTEKKLKMIQDWIHKDPVMVIDLNTFKLRPPKYK